MNIFEQAALLEQQNQAFALASIIETKGSAPRHSGKMIVKHDGSIIGTVGGGMIERYVIEQAIEAINEGLPRTVNGRMTRTGQDAMGMDCGGAMKVFIDVVANKPKLLLVGGGHVNRAIAKAAFVLGFDITVADAYEESLNEQHYPIGTKRILGDTMEDAMAKLPITPDSFVIIATNHQDRDAISKLASFDCCYLGLMASKRKVQVLFDHLRSIGFSEQQIAKIHSPIGFNIGAETPEEIAISVLAEILKVKHQASGKQLTDEVNETTSNKLVVIRGAGDMASGVALRLFKAGFDVIMTEIEQPTHIRRSVAFAQCLFQEHMELEGVTAKKANGIHEAKRIIKQGNIAVLVDPNCQLIKNLKPRYLVDAILAKRNMGTNKQMAPFTVALGPGFTAGEDCHCAIETNRGHYLGKLIYQGSTAPNTGVPGNIAGYTSERVVRSPLTGTLHAKVDIGQLVEEGEVIAYVNDTPIISPLTGMVRGLLNSDLPVTEGFKIGDIDPRGKDADYCHISDKARAISGSVLEAIMSFEVNR